MAVTKLELTWVGKDEPMQKIEPRLLLHDKGKSYGEPGTGNMLIHGDNLLALRALLPKYGGQVRCAYADIPYNTGSAFSQYDDNLEHSTWLNLIRPRMEILYKLLREDGSLWVSIDDDEQADHEQHECQQIIDVGTVQNHDDPSFSSENLNTRQRR